MQWINYHHLLYFWLVAREGSIAKACRQLRLTQPTISAQIRALEDQIGEKLFIRSGRNLVLTEIGRLVYGYADEIFTLGRELSDTLKGRPTGRPLRLAVGITDSIPKLIVYRLLKPALEMREPVRLVCREGKPQELFADLVTHNLDLVLADAPAGPESRVRIFNHMLGDCTVTFFASEDVAAKLTGGFPASLDGAPMLCPTEGTALRRSMDQWFDTHAVRPKVVGEMADSALMKMFGAAGTGIFPGPAVIEAEIQAQYGVRVIGRAEEVHERFYAISIERKLKNPAVLAISDFARAKLFSTHG